MVVVVVQVMVAVVVVVMVAVVVVVAAVLCKSIFCLCNELSTSLHNSSSNCIAAALLE